MIRALIIEDEKYAASHLKKLINDGRFKIEIIDVLDSVKQAVQWLSANKMPDLIFLDVQLSDGISFEIFNNITVSCPIIFTTAYEEYAIKAFKLNSIDYLLKPVNMNDLTYAINKFEMYEPLTVNNVPGDLQQKFENVLKIMLRQYKSRFIVNAGIHIKSVETDKIYMFYSLEKATYLFDENGKSYDINYSLDQTENLVDPEIFFRISRKHIVNINAIEDIVNYSSSRLKLKIKNCSDNDVFVSRSNIKKFRIWLDK